MTVRHWEKVVLGIDAAWTVGQPSGVSLVAFDGSEWLSLAVAPSYQQFLDYDVDNTTDLFTKPTGGHPDINILTEKTMQLTDGRRPDVIAIDMPLGYTPITGRREADNAVSRAYGSRKCAVHSPTAERPGKISDDLTVACRKAGYSLSTTDDATQVLPCLIEVYPHTAILELLSLEFRHTYKVGNSTTYWPEAGPEERKVLLIQSLQMILDALNKEIQGIDIKLPSNVTDFTFSYLKRYEDVIDALVCAWIAIRYLQGECVAYGDDSAVIWTPGR